MKKTVFILSILAINSLSVAICAEVFHLCDLGNVSFYQCWSLLAIFIPAIIAFAFMNSNQNEKLKRIMLSAIAFIELLISASFAVLGNFVVPTTEIVMFNDNIILAIIHMLVLVGIFYCALFPNRLLSVIVGASAICKNIALFVFASFTYNTVPVDFTFFVITFIMFDVIFILQMEQYFSQTKTKTQDILDDMNGYSCRTFLEAFAAFHFTSNNACEYLLFYEFIRDRDYDGIVSCFMNSREFIERMATDLPVFAHHVGLDKLSEKTIAFVGMLYHISTCENDEDFNHAVFRLINIIQFDKKYDYRLF